MSSRRIALFLYISAVLGQSSIIPSPTVGASAAPSIPSDSPVLGQSSIIPSPTVDASAAPSIPSDSPFQNNTVGQINSFTTALQLSNTTDYTGNVTIDATRLYGYDGCDNFQANQIYSGWQQSWKIMNTVKDGDVDFNSAAALEFLGASGLNADKHDAINNLYKNLNTIQPRFIPLPFDWRIHVRCDDPKVKCPCGSPKEKTLYAYTHNKDDDSGLARINFCPLYFKTTPLNTIINFMKNEEDKTFKFDIDQYHASQGHVWIHELLHIDWVSQAKDYGSNDHVTDLKITLRTGNRNKDYKAYGGRFTKILARWDINTGSYVMQNADNLAIHPLALYVQSELNNQYPLYPLVNDESKGPPHAFIISSNGSVTLNDTDPDVEAWSLPDTSCDDDEDAPASASPIIINSFAPSSAYPADYYSTVSSLASAETPPPTGDPTPLPAAATSTTNTFSCTSSAAPGASTDFPCACSDGKSYCANAGSCSYDAPPAAENCCESCM